MDESEPVPGIRGWALWGLPRRAVAAVIAVEVAALAAVLASAAAPDQAALVLGAFLALVSVAHTELATGIERIRRRTSATSYFDLSSVWTFAAALLLPPIVAAGVIIVVYVHLWHRVWRPAHVPLHRHLYTTATVLLAAAAAHAVLGWAGGLPAAPNDTGGVLALVAAVLSYAVVNIVLVACVIALTQEGATRDDLVGRWDDNALEVATLCMGALAAVAISATPVLVALVLPPVLVLHRAVLVRQLEQVASTDGKTGLLNAASWQLQAGRVIRRVRRGGGAAAVLILDLDHFKRVNDEHGHLAGDEVLAAVAAELRTCVRADDLVGRFGGEEFVVLLADLPDGSRARGEMSRIAERIRTRIEAMQVLAETPEGVQHISGLSVSVGGATVPADGTTLDQVLKTADSALYAAKRGGRNLVRIAGGVEVPFPRDAAP